MLVPAAVHHEALRGPAHPDVVAIRAALGEGRIEVDARELATEAPGVADLGAGEAAVIALARELRAVAVLDDRQARTAARALGVHVIGSVGVLVQARRARLIPAVTPLVEQLAASGFRVGASQLEFARDADEQ